MSLSRREAAVNAAALKDPAWHERRQQLAAAWSQARQDEYLDSLLIWKRQPTDCVMVGPAEENRPATRNLPARAGAHDLRRTSQRIHQSVFAVKF